MINVKYPQPNFNLKKEKGREFIFDNIRKKWIVLTPEEWVRQNFINVLVQELQYPAALIGIEKEIQMGELRKRYDILVYDAQHRPWMLVECKAMEVALNENVLEQLLRYNISLPAPYLFITNGTACFAWKNEKGQLLPLRQFPLFGE